MELVAAMRALARGREKERGELGEGKVVINRADVVVSRLGAEVLGVSSLQVSAVACAHLAPFHLGIPPGRDGGQFVGA